MMKNVLVVIQTSVFGGPHNQVLQLYEGLQKNGYNYIALIPDEKGNAKSILESKGIKVITVPYSRMRKTFNPSVHAKYFKSFFTDIKTIRKIIRKENIAFVQVCGLLNLQAGFAAKLEKKKLVWQLLSNYAPKSIRTVVSPIVCKLADAIMSTGFIVAKDHPFVANHKRLTSFFPPVNLEKFRRPSEVEILESKKRLNVGATDFTIGTIGNFNRQKSHEFLIDIFNDFHKKHSGVKLRILGSPTDTNLSYYDKEVIQRAKNYGLLENGACEFINIGRNVVEYAQGIDVFVLSSQAEGIPTVMLEAMAMGKPVISTNVGSVAEIISDEVGFLVPFGDKKSFLERLDYMVTNPEARKKIGDKAFELTQTKFNIRQTLEDHIKVFDEISST